MNTAMEGDDVSNNSKIWQLFGKRVPKAETVFISQVIILYIVIITCIVNLSMKNGISELWVSLLSYSLGCLLPSPRLKKPHNPKNGSNVETVPENNLLQS